MKAIGAIALAALALLASGCGGASVDSAKSAAAARRAPSCPSARKLGWQRLANKIHAPVYCPRWLPSPLDGVIGGQWNTVNSVSPDRSYLVGFAWWEQGSGEVHVNLRGYPGQTRIPTCPGDVRGSTVPCFADSRGTVRSNGITATVFTVNQGADQWHVLYAWYRWGSLYTLSEHVTPPYTYRQVIANLHRMLLQLVVVEPRA